MAAWAKAYGLPLLADPLSGLRSLGDEVVIDNYDNVLGHDDFPVPDQEAAKYLVSCGLKGVGTDALSVDTLRDQQFLAHKTLLDGGLVILESLCLKKVVGRTDLMLFALPLKFENADGAPVRAIAEFRDFPEEKEMEAL